MFQKFMKKEVDRLFKEASLDLVDGGLSFEELFIKHYK